MSQSTANTKQNLQNDLCILGRLRSDYTWLLGLWQDRTEVQADVSTCWELTAARSLRLAARAPQPMLGKPAL